MAHLRVTPSTVIFSLIPFLQKKLFLFFFLVFLSKKFYCWHKYQSLIVSSVVGAPWSCGVLTTEGGIAGIGSGHLLGREHDSTPRSVCASSLTKAERSQIGLLLLLRAAHQMCVNVQTNDLQQKNPRTSVTCEAGARTRPHSPSDNTNA